MKIKQIVSKHCLPFQQRLSILIEKSGDLQSAMQIDHTKVFQYKSQFLEVMKFEFCHFGLFWPF